MRTLFLTLCLCFSLLSIAQGKESSISVGPSLGIPSNFRGNWGSGASIRGYIGTTRRSAILINSSAIFYPYSYVKGTEVVTMLKLGYKTKLLHSNLFLYGDAGVAISYGAWSDGSNPAAGIGIGYSLPVGERKYVDITPSWNFWLRPKPEPWLINSSRLELHFAYRFAFK